MYTPTIPEPTPIQEHLANPWKCMCPTCTDRICATSCEEYLVDPLVAHTPEEYESIWEECDEDLRKGGRIHATMALATLYLLLLGHPRRVKEFQRYFRRFTPRTSHATYTPYTTIYQILMRTLREE